MKFYLTLLMTLIVGALSAQEQISMYDVLPNTKDTAKLDKNTPELYFYSPEVVSKNKVFLILPGGGYHHLAMDHEGHAMAKRLSDLGYYAFVLKYRLPTSKQQLEKKIAPIQDAQRALYLVREKVKDLKLKNPKVGVMGSSAGGHLASTLSTHYDMDYHNKNISAKILRPDFSVLIYPVISMEDGVTHNGSKNNLIGPDVSEEDLIRFSNEKNINKKTPPAYLIHAKDDKVVPIENSLRYQRELIKYNIPNYLFTYELGGHGFGMNNKQEPREWFESMLEWLESIKL
ncbi:MAG: alpha/beta hydrolase [Sphingobacterium composti]